MDPFNDDGVPLLQDEIDSFLRGGKVAGIEKNLLTEELEFSIPTAPRLKTLALTYIGTGIIKGLLSDLGLRHLEGDIHGRISMEYIGVHKSWPQGIPDKGGKMNWTGRLLKPRGATYYQGGEQKSRLMAEDFKAMARTIREIFELAGEELTSELNHLVDVMGTASHTDSQPDLPRGFVYCHPSTMTLTQKFATLFGREVLFKRNEAAKNLMQAGMGFMDPDAFRAWRSAMQRLPRPSVYFDSSRKLEADKGIKHLSEQKEQDDSNAVVEPQFAAADFFDYISRPRSVIDMAGLNVDLPTRLNDLYVLFPNFLSHFLRVTLRDPKVRLRVYSDEFYVCAKLLARIQQVEGDWPM